MSESRTDPVAAQLYFGVPIALAGAGALVPYLHVPAAQAIASIVIAMLWILSLGLAVAKVGRAAWWLMLGAPFVFAMPLLYGFLFATCSVSACDF